MRHAILIACQCIHYYLTKAEKGAHYVYLGAGSLEPHFVGYACQTCLVLAALHDGWKILYLVKQKGDDE